MSAAALPREPVWRSRVGIPVRNLWMLLVYASGLAEFLHAADGDADGDAELPDLLARLLTVVVARRLRRNLSRGYAPRAELLTRVRGRIDWLETERGLHLRRGRIACRFEALTQDTPRNRLVRAALDAMRGRVADQGLADDCARLAQDLARAGVSPVRPSRAEVSRDRIGRHEAEDRLMVAVATLTLDVVLPAEADGPTPLTRLDRDEALLRRIFEKGVAGFYRHEMHGRDGWRVRPQASLYWQKAFPTVGLEPFLPSMAADLILEGGGRRIVLDTKFTGILRPGRFGGETFKSEHLYQLYAYLRSQTGRDAAADVGEGILLHPSIDRNIDEAVTIQGHRIRFVTIDLTLPSSEIRAALLRLPAAYQAT